MEKPNVFTVKHEDKEMQVIIPDTGDKSENEFLEVAEREKTLDQLKKRPAREKSKLSGEDRAGAIKEYNDWKKQRESRTINPRYYSVGSYTS
tara:strand:+ start:20889 stop:21164 length:276 start_codon:yes stop_codon:yes gene_type:complete